MPTPRFSNNNQNEGHTQWHTSYRSPSISNINRITLYVFFYVCARFAEYNAKSMSAKPSKHKMKKKRITNKIYEKWKQQQQQRIKQFLFIKCVLYRQLLWGMKRAINASYRRDIIQRARFRSNTYFCFFCVWESHSNFYRFLPKKKLILQGND